MIVPSAANLSFSHSDAGNLRYVLRRRRKQHNQVSSRHKLEGAVKTSAETSVADNWLSPYLPDAHSSHLPLQRGHFEELLSVVKRRNMNGSILAQL